MLGYILAGGQSRRFGRDKAREHLLGIPALLTVRTSLENLVEDTWVVVDQEGRYRDLGVKEIPDEIPGRGPVAGVYTALTHAQRTIESGRNDSWILVLACDEFGISPDWIRTLMAHRNLGQVAVAFGKGRWEPFPCLLRTSAIDIAHRVVGEVKPTMQGLLSALGAVQVPLPGEFASRVNMNTPSDLAGAVKLLSNPGVQQPAIKGLSNVMSGQPGRKP